MAADLYNQLVAIKGDSVGVTFVKKTVEDIDILQVLDSAAKFSWMVSCQQVLNNRKNYLVGKRQKKVWAIFSEKTIAFSTPEYDFDYFTLVPSNRRWDTISYPHVEYGLVTEVFYQRWETCKTRFWEKLRIFEEKNNLTDQLNQYTFTGFGIGAVLAVFAALEYKREYMKASITLITFGQPRIGNNQFVYYIELMVKPWRVTYGDDSIPNFPIEGFDREKKRLSNKAYRSPNILYRHFRKEFWIEPSCDCANPKIYLCYHTVTLDENERQDLEFFKTDSIKEKNKLEERYTGHSFFVKSQVKNNELLKMLSKKAELAWKAQCYLAEKLLQKKKVYFLPLSHDDSKFTFSFADINVRNFEKWAGQKSKRFKVIQFPDVNGAWITLGYYEKWIKRFRKLFFKSLEKILKSSQKKPDYTDFEFTGFGESGPYAVFAALEFSEKYQPRTNPIVVTFGQPRMGNEIFTAFAQTKLRIFRVTFQDDWLPNLPRQALRTFLRWNEDIERPVHSFPRLYEEFKHFKPEFWIKEENCECSENSYPIVYKCLNTVSYDEHPECNARKHIHELTEGLLRLQEYDHFHYGPYFGKNMKNFIGFEKNLTASKIDNSGVKFVKEVVTKKPTLSILSSTAFSAWEASCQQIFETNKFYDLYGSGNAKVWVIISDTTIAFGAFDYEFNYMTVNLKQDYWDVIPYPYVELGFVSKLFYRRWQKFATQFWEKLSESNKPKKSNKYIFTGFGIGAVFATFASLEYKRKYLDASLTLITFGQPRIGNDQFVYYTEYMLDKPWRVTYGDDWMPNFPIEGSDRETQKLLGKAMPFQISYKHLRQEFWIEPSCDCPIPKIYLCYHTATLNENEPT
ncbi:hypothetical protein G9A89_010553 [Geosiphon pyriformis]|nr:hypothetical protein G9A89_010553 [Geosiphon pyriformis]